MTTADVRVAVIGGGIAGVSAAAALAQHRSGPEVTLFEAEGELAAHTTGRSAAQLVVNYGAGPVRPLTAAGLSHLRAPDPGLHDGPLLSARPIVTVARPDQVELIDARLAEARRTGTELAEITPDEAQSHFPALRPEGIARAVIEPDSADIDVAGLHQGFVRALRRAGAAVATRARVDAVTRNRTGRTWTVAHTGGRWEADLVVNAAGAWGDVVARGADVEPVGLTPLRRTAFMVASDRDDSSSWAMVEGAAHDWYLKPDGAQFLCSPADEHPSEPTDAKPEEEDVAVAIDRINQATDLAIRHVRSSWAGLRTFAPDRSMVIGPDPDQPGFVWCVGQGGTGIQTAAPVGWLVADLVLDGAPGSRFDGIDLRLDDLTPDRLRRP
jgi:D-arginine dehydrogenase